MPLTDARGLPVSTTSETAAGLYRDGVDLLLSAWPGAVDLLSAATMEDPEFALAHAALARAYAVRADIASAKAAIARAEVVAVRQATPREHSHVAALSAAIHGQSGLALDRALEHISSWPRDVIILGLPLGAFGLFAFSGMADHDHARASLCNRVASHFGTEDWWFLTSRGWSLTEAGDVVTGRHLTQRGFDLRRANANGAHALSHALFEQGASADVDAMLTAWLPSYDRSGTLHGHLAWHIALAALERGDAEGALTIYRQSVQPAVSRGLPINIVSDSVSLLWRVAAYGYAVPEHHWSEAKAFATTAFPTAGHAFVEVHMGLLAAATGDGAMAHARIEQQLDLIQAGRLPAGPIVPTICRSALAFAEGNYRQCLLLLDPLTQDIARVGGSGAQREIVDDLLLLALIRSGDVEKARQRLSERLNRRPSARDHGWLAGLIPPAEVQAKTH